jgi:7,8-dihydropterin-6-yl-methyl-4-(beta-D-ribofuranosyl)aminobenzene 5'-phosphate synthase
MLRITTLSENTAGRRGLLGEWGLSVLLETGESNILFDCGQTISTVHNADALNIDLTKVNRIVLSHGHYDHTGGLHDVLKRIGREVEIIAHPDIWQDKFARRKGEADRYIGIPCERRDLERLGAQFNLDAHPVQVAENMITTGEIPMITTFEEVDSTLWIKEDLIWKSDPVKDDLALVYKTGAGLVVISGCAHRGIINTLYHAQQITGVKQIYMVIGGSHLSGVSEERLWQTIATLKEIDIQRIGLCHCTDLPVAGILAGEFGERFFFNKAGSTIEIP